MTTTEELIRISIQIFRESKETTSVDDILYEYSCAIDGGNGGLLLSVIGGKMSEGINFSDRLGRGVIVVGLPFPNIHSPDWQAKLEHIENNTYERIIRVQDDDVDVDDDNLVAGPPQFQKAARAQAKAVARDFYENACMRAVNQSIGRAIRHRNDHACIILLDRRYSTDRIRAKLPAWIQRGLALDPATTATETKNFAALMGSVSTFFRSKTVT